MRIRKMFNAVFTRKEDSEKTPLSFPNSASKKGHQDLKKDSKRDSDYYSSKLYLGIDKKKKPTYIEFSDFEKLNVHVIGALGSQKMSAVAAMADQLIRSGYCFFHIATNEDEETLNAMIKACAESGRKLKYLSFGDGYGQWAPFAGGDMRDAFQRLVSAVDLNDTGSASDYYRSIERSRLAKAFEKTRNVVGLQNALITDWEQTSRKGREGNPDRLLEKLNEWKNDTFSPKGPGFSIETALKENAVVYVQGSTRAVETTAMRLFVGELVAESKRLRRARTNHLTVSIGDLESVASEELASAVATCISNRTNFIISHQPGLERQLSSNPLSKCVWRIANEDAGIKYMFAMPVSSAAGVPEIEVTWRQHIKRGCKPVIAADIFPNLKPKECVLFQSNELPKHLHFLGVETDQSLVDAFHGKLERLTQFKVEQEKSEKRKREQQRKDSLLTRTSFTSDDLMVLGKVEKETPILSEFEEMTCEIVSHLDENVGEETSRGIKEALKENKQENENAKAWEIVIRKILREELTVELKRYKTEVVKDVLETLERKKEIEAILARVKNLPVNRKKAFAAYKTRGVLRGLDDYRSVKEAAEAMKHELKKANPE